MSKRLVSRTLPLLLLFLLALVLQVEYFFEIPQAGAVAGQIRGFAVIISGFAMALGAISLITYHLRAVMRKKPGEWYYSAWLVVVLVGTLVGGVVLTPKHPIYNTIWYLFNQSIVVSIVGLMIFFFMTGTFRSFRLRSLEAGFMMGGAIIMLLYYAPIGRYIFPGIAPIAMWINDVPTTSASRAIELCGGLGMMALAIRTFLGQEAGFLGGVAEE